MAIPYDTHSDGFAVVATRDENGVWTLTNYGEDCDAFEAEMPNWRKRQAEADKREAGDLVTEDDFEIGENEWHQQIADWDAFYEMEAQNGNL